MGGFCFEDPSSGLKVLGYVGNPNTEVECMGRQVHMPARTRDKDVKN